jgi:hypothetical protein
MGAKPMQFDEVLERTGQTETTILREHAILTIMTKLSRYEAECALYEKKYDASLESFLSKLEQKLNSENFTEEDDLLDWEYANSARNWWRVKLFSFPGFILRSREE